ncbi:MAG TPA: nucleotidyltransferase family protein [Chitinophagaceae bacterium]|nr:nucleotidyltransferase family protein [Chitinophagaceae bacterium]
MKAMILAAGLGTRLKPFTDSHPKALAIVNQKTILSRNIEYLKSFGITDIIINVHHFANQIIDHINENQNFGINITISDETNEVLETGGGLKKAAWFFNDHQPFVLMNVDILTDMNLGNMIQYHLDKKPLATLAVSERTSSRCFLFNKTNELCGWKNKQTNEEKISKPNEELIPYSFSGIHIIDPTLLPLIKQEGKFSLVDVYLDLAKTQTILGYNHTGCHLMDVGKPESIIEAEKIFI